MLNEESLVINAVSKISPSVVTVGVVRQRQLNFQDQYIGTGFILTGDGLIVTNKHVVSESTFKYTVITKDNKKLEVQNIYRDPSNDLAILKVNASNLKPAELGDSSKLKVGQLAVTIGTALGEFRDTVTTGVISGLGRVITAGDEFSGYQEKQDNLIQTDAAINPGNSGGPLLNSSGQVIGVNVAIAASGQNIGFALPINLVKDVVENFNNTGKFSRPYLGIRYTQISKQAAILNEVPEGAYVREVLEESPAEKGGVQVNDIITKIDGVAVNETNGGLTKIIARHKVGDKVQLSIFRDDDKELTITLTLEEAKL